MQKQLGRIERASGRSTKKVAPKKIAPKKLGSSKRTARKHAHVSVRTRISPPSSPLTTWESQVAPEAVATTEESAKSIVSSSPLMPWENRTRVPRVTATTVPEAPPTTANGVQNIASSRSLMPCEYRTRVLSAARTAIPQGETSTTKKYWKYVVTETMKLPSMIMSFLGWRTHRMATQQTQMVLQMLVLNGSVRSGDVEFRYGNSPEEGGVLSRSFAAPPPSDGHPPTSLQAGCARLRTRGIQLIEEARLQERYARVQSRGMQLLEWLRRELTTLSYSSRM
jgi:hypothetical protein